MHTTFVFRADATQLSRCLLETDRVLFFYACHARYYAVSIDFKGEFGKPVRTADQFRCEYTDAHAPRTHSHGYGPKTRDFYVNEVLMSR